MAAGTVNATRKFWSVLQALLVPCLCCILVSNSH